MSKTSILTIYFGIAILYTIYLKVFGSYIYDGYYGLGMAIAQGLKWPFKLLGAIF